MRRFLSVEAAAESVSRPSLRACLPHAWHFLNITGLINFGCNLPSLKESLAPSTGTSPSPEDEAIPTKTVIIIGAGLSGAAAASQLTRWGYNVVILEGRNRPGGRVHTARLESKSHPGVAAVADLGGAVIQGVDGNPMAVISHQLGIPMSAVGSECRIDVEGLAKGKRCGDIDRKIMYLHDRLLDECVEHAKNLGPVSSIISVGSAYEALWRDGEDWESRYDEYKLKRQEEDEEEEDKEEKEEGETITDPRERLKIAKQLINWKIAHDEFAAAATMRSVSLTGWNIDDKYEITGHHAFLPGGNIRLVQGLLKDVPVLYGTEVKKVEQSKECVLVTTAGGQTFKADSCLVTVPLGVLKKGLITFQPPLPQEKQVSIKKLGFGLLNKLCLLFPHAFWNDKDDQ